MSLKTLQKITSYTYCLSSGFQELWEQVHLHISKGDRFILFFPENVYHPYARSVMVAPIIPQAIMPFPPDMPGASPNIHFSTLFLQQPHFRDWLDVTRFVLVNTSSLETGDFFTWVSRCLSPPWWQGRNKCVVLWMAVYFFLLSVIWESVFIHYQMQWTRHLVLRNRSTKKKVSSLSPTPHPANASWWGICLQVTILHSYFGFQQLKKGWRRSKEAGLIEPLQCTYHALPLCGSVIFSLCSDSSWVLRQDLRTCWK